MLETTLSPQRFRTNSSSSQPSVETTSARLDSREAVNGVSAYPAGRRHLTPVARRATRLYPSMLKPVLVNGVCMLIASRIFLNATNEKALDKVSLDDLKKFAVDKE